MGINIYQKTLAGICLIYYSIGFSQVQPTITENYIHIIEPINSSTVANNQSAGIRTIQYIDGLGRPKQNIQVLASPTPTGMKDLVTHIGYDDFGRQEKDYLSLPTGQSNGSYINPIQLTNSDYYQDNYGESSWFNHKQFDNSPLNRVVKEGSPGDDWKLGSGNEVKYEYLTNTTNDQVLIFWIDGNGNLTKRKDIDGNGTTDVYYLNSRLYKNVIIDENGNKTEEYTNKENQLLLRRAYVSTVANAGSRGTGPGSPQQAPERVDTYYVYNTYGNLVYIIPPLLSKSYVGTGALPTNWGDKMNNLGYVYRYDEKNRVVEKKLPGKGWEWMVYDKQDRLVATKDAKQVTEGNYEWSYIKYDNLGRVAYTGLVWDQGDRIQVQNAVNSFGNNNAEYDGTGFSTDNLQVYYKKNKGYPASDSHILTINYYDKYAPSRVTDQVNFPVIPGVNIRDGVDNTGTRSLKGLLTSTVNRVMSTWGFEKNYIFYDTKSRAVYTHKIDHLGGFTKIQNNLDFRGKPISTITTHRYSTNGNEIKVQNNFTYDSQERLKTHTQSINNGVVQRIATNTYNELGQLTYKLVGNNNSLPALQGIDYSYNIRGWLTGINDITNNLQLRGLPGAPMDDIFAFKIQHNKLIYGGEVAAVPLYNGNISQTFWKSASDNKTRGYSYEYDQMNRLRFAHFNRLSSATQTGYYPGAFDESMAYDLNGNIIHLIRNSEDQYGAEMPMDDLRYTYKDGNASSNQLLKVVDNATSNSTNGFNNGSSQDQTDYTYDENGNMTSDKNKNITSIDYNSLNLPTKIKWNNLETRKIEFLYNSAGVKVQKKLTVGTTVTTTDYIDGFQYINGVLQFFPHAEGYVKNTVVNGQNTYDYVFHYKDHLNNVRMAYAKDPQTGDLKILEEHHYYPFGFKHKNYANIEYKIDAINNETDKAVLAIDISNPSVASTYKYRFQGQERQEDLSLNWDSFKWRNYDYAIGRFMSIDPLSEKYAYQSHYNFSENRVVDGRELEGLEWAPQSDPMLEVGETVASGFNGLRAAFSNVVVRGINLFRDEPINNRYEVADNGQLVKLINKPAETPKEQIFNTAFDGLTIAGSLTGGTTGVLTAKTKAPILDVLGDARKSSLYENVTNKSKNGGIPTVKNRATDVNRSEFENNLQKSGFEKNQINDKVTKFEKDGKTYITRPDKGGGVSADYRKKSASKDPDLKIRLGGEQWDFKP